MQVNDIMNSKPAVISPQASLPQALAMMAERKNRHLMVLDDQAMVLGILSDKDLAMAYDPAAGEGSAWQHATVKQLMTARPVTIGSKAEVGEAARLLLKTAVSAMPVVDNGQLVGLLTDRDFTRYFALADRI